MISSQGQRRLLVPLSLGESEPLCRPPERQNEMVRELKTLRASRAAEIVLLERNRLRTRQPAPEVSFAGRVGVRRTTNIHNYWYTVGSGSPLCGKVLR